MCGIIGIIGKKAITKALYQGMIQLQHRGQDAAGIFTYDPQNGHHFLYKKLGLVSKSLAHQHIPDAPWAIGHLRYTTAGSGRIEDTQPLSGARQFLIAIAHNGNIVNYLTLKNEMLRGNAMFETTSDTEVLLQILAQKLTGDCSFDVICDAISYIYENVFGAYSVIAIIAGVGMIAFRDPLGIRPLQYGYNSEEEMHAFASESDALKFLDVEKVQDVVPGEIIFIDGHHNLHRRQLLKQKPAHCSFEFNYFSSPTSVLENREVYRVRAHLGAALEREVRKAGIKADVVVPIPDTGWPSALTLAASLGIPIEQGFIKRDHIGRTFIIPTQYERKKALLHKLAVVESVFEGKDVILVDDSIVRGTVSRRVVNLARNAGARKVYFASTFPPIRHPCFYGFDFPLENQLIAAQKKLDEISQELECDGVIYNTEESLKAAIGLEGLCMACMTGDYPTEIRGNEELIKMRDSHLKLQEGLS